MILGQYDAICKAQCTWYKSMYFQAMAVRTIEQFICSITLKNSVECEPGTTANPNKPEV